jgi:hypothetical protein
MRPNACHTCEKCLDSPTEPSSNAGIGANASSMLYFHQVFGEGLLLLDLRLERFSEEDGALCGIRAVFWRIGALSFATPDNRFIEDFTWTTAPSLARDSKPWGS